MAAEAPELVECVQLMGAALHAHLEKQATWDAAKLDAEAGFADWRQLLASAKSDLLQHAFLAALRIAARRYVESTGDFAALDAAGGDLRFPMILRRPDPESGAQVRIELDASMDGEDPRAQLILFAAAGAAETAYEQALARFGPGRLYGMRALRNLQVERRVLEELMAGHASDADAYKVAGVSSAAGERIKRRLGRTKPPARG